MEAITLKLKNTSYNKYKFSSQNIIIFIIYGQEGLSDPSPVLSRLPEDIRKADMTKAKTYFCPPESLLYIHLNHVLVLTKESLWQHLLLLKLPMQFFPAIKKADPQWQL